MNCNCSECNSEQAVHDAITLCNDLLLFFEQKDTNMSQRIRQVLRKLTTEEPLPCPFCNGEPFVTCKQDDNTRYMAYINCIKCGSMYGETTYAPKKEDAVSRLIKKWNTRRNGGAG